MSRSHPPAGPVRWDVVAKPGGGSRRLARLSRTDDVRFRSLVARVVPSVERSLGETVLANRTARGSGPSMLSPWRPAHRRWQRAIARAADDPGTVVATDVAECYGSISPTAVGRALERAGAGGEHVARLVGWLRDLERFGVVGLPIGPEPSAILANAVLSIGDRSLDDAGVRWFRWVDDWVIVADGPAGATRALAALASALEPEGLRLHDTKTVWWDDRTDVVARGNRSWAHADPGRSPTDDARERGGGMA